MAANVKDGIELDGESYFDSAAACNDEILFIFDRAALELCNATASEDETDAGGTVAGFAAARKEDIFVGSRFG